MKYNLHILDCSLSFDICLEKRTCIVQIRYYKDSKPKLDQIRPLIKEGLDYALENTLCVPTSIFTIADSYLVKGVLVNAEN